MDEYLQIGKTLKAHGIKGEIKLLVEEFFEEEVEETEVLFLEIKGQKVPFSVEHLRGGGLPILKLEGIDTRTQAEQYEHLAVFLKRAAVRMTDSEIRAHTEGKYFYLQGFVMVDETEGEVGEIVQIEQYPQQEMAIIERGEKTLLVPLHPVFILREDHAERRLYVSLPEGLLDL